MKTRILSEDIRERRITTKAQNIINFLTNVNSNNSDFQSLALLKSLELNLAANMLEKIDKVFDSEYIAIKEEINSLQTLLKSITDKLTSLKKPMVELSFDNLHMVFSPRFSGEFDIQNQFNNLINNGMSQDFSVSLLNKYAKEISSSNTNSLNDLFELKTLIIPNTFKNSFEALRNITLLDNNSLHSINSVNSLVGYQDQPTHRGTIKQQKKPSEKLQEKVKDNVQPIKADKVVNVDKENKENKKQPTRIQPTKQPSNKPKFGSIDTLGNVPKKGFSTKNNKYSLDEESKISLTEATENFAKYLSKTVI